MIEQDVSECNYKLIEYVYTYHPCIHEVHGKKQVADLYLMFGIGIFKDMHGTAETAKGLEDDVNKKKAEYQKASNELNMFKSRFKAGWK